MLLFFGHNNNFFPPQGFLERKKVYLNEISNHCAKTYHLHTHQEKRLARENTTAAVKHEIQQRGDRADSV